LRLLLVRVVLPLSLLLSLTAGAIGYYNWRVTGNPFRLPYAVSMATVNPVPYFPWQTLRPIPDYHYKLIRDFYLNWGLPQYQQLRSFHGWIAAAKNKIRRLSTFYLGAAFGFPIVIAVLMGGFRSVFLGRLNFLFICFGVTLAGLLLEVQYIPHYAAPITAIFLAIVVQSVRYVQVRAQRGKSRFLFAVRTVPIICLISILLGMTQLWLGFNMNTDWPHSWYSRATGNTERAGIVDWLEHQPGQHLVIVRYSPRHNVHDEWVYNLSDLDGTKIIWARDMDFDHNQELISYFQNRTVWLVEPDNKRSGKVQVQPYASSLTMNRQAIGETETSALY
jgi:hypothetical protein